MTNLAYLGRHRTIHCIGDSNTLAFDEMAFRLMESDAIYACRSAYLRGVFAEDLLTADGSLLPTLRSRLIAQSLLIGEEGLLEAAHVTGNAHWRAVEFARERGFSEPILLFHFGDMDLRFIAIPRIAAANDFIFPDAPVGSMLGDIDRSREIIPYSLVRGLAASAMSPYMNALALLKRSGFRRVFAHTLSPQIIDDDAYGATYGYAPVAIRYKIIHVFNNTLRDLAAECGIDVVDTWNETTTDGILKPEYNLDNAHLNSAAARLSITKLINAVDAE